MSMILVIKPLLMRAKFKSTMREKESKVRMVRSAKIVDLVAMANVVVAEEAAEVEPVAVRLRIPTRVTVLSNNSAMMAQEMKVTSLDSVVVVAVAEDPAETTTEKYVTMETTIDPDLLAITATTVMIDATTVAITTMIDTITTIAMIVMTVMIVMTAKTVTKT